MTRVLTDPSIGQMEFRDPTIPYDSNEESTTPAHTLKKQEKYLFLCPLYNESFVNAVPPRGFMYEFDFGPFLRMDHEFEPDPKDENGESYFIVQERITNGHSIVKALLNKELPATFPADFQLKDQICFRMLAIAVGHFEITAKLIPDATVINDYNIPDNSGKLEYDVNL